MLRTSAVSNPQPFFDFKAGALTTVLHPLPIGPRKPKQSFSKLLQLIFPLLYFSSPPFIACVRFFLKQEKKFEDLFFQGKSFRLNSDPDVSKRGERSKPSKDKKISGILYLLWCSLSCCIFDLFGPILLLLLLQHYSRHFEWKIVKKNLQVLP